MQKEIHPCFMCMLLILRHFFYQFVNKDTLRFDLDTVRRKKKENKFRRITKFQFQVLNQSCEREMCLKIRAVIDWH